MTDPNTTISNLQKTLQTAIKKTPELKGMKIFLFGSQAMRKATPKSDIDIGIISHSHIPAAALFHFEEELEKLPLLQIFDIVDFSRVPKTFAEHALKHYIVLSS